VQARREGFETVGLQVLGNRVDLGGYEGLVRERGIQHIRRRERELGYDFERARGSLYFAMAGSTQQPPENPDSSLFACGDDAIEIDAIQTTNDNSVDVNEFCRGVLREARRLGLHHDVLDWL